MNRRERKGVVVVEEEEDEEESNETNWVEFPTNGNSGNFAIDDVVPSRTFSNRVLSSQGGGIKQQQQQQMQPQSQQQVFAFSEQQVMESEFGMQSGTMSV